MLSLDEVPIDETEIWDSQEAVDFRVHVNEFDDDLAKSGRIWAVDVKPYSIDDRHYFVVEKIVINCETKTSKLETEQPRAYLHGFGRVIKVDQRIRIYGKTY